MRILYLAIATAAAIAAPSAEAQSWLKKLARTAGQVVGDPTVSQVLVRMNADGGAGFENYGAWEFKVDEVLVGPDGEWQAVITARNMNQSRQGMVASEIKAALITADGETLQNWGELYRASSTGGGVGLEPVPGTLWVEPGDSVRVRLRFSGSRGLEPKKIRLSSTGATAQSRTFDLN